MRKLLCDKRQIAFSRRVPEPERAGAEVRRAGVRDATDQRVELRRPVRNPRKNRHDIHPDIDARIAESFDRAEARLWCRRTRLDAPSEFRVDGNQRYMDMDS